ncbi:MAG TPA: multidrug transporter [Pseudomonas sp.]|nr:multidrug transporter [Pseudomonas sp.]
MLFGALLVVTWLILLTRYPHKALPVSLAALCGIGLLAAWVLWQEARDEDRLARLELSISYAPQQCSAQRPLLVSLRNTSTLPLRELTWHTTAYRAGDDLNLVRAETLARYHAAAPLAPDAQWRDCLPLPALRPGYRPETLQFRAERRRGHFAK